MLLYVHVFIDLLMDVMLKTLKIRKSTSKWLKNVAQIFEKHEQNKTNINPAHCGKI